MSRWRKGRGPADPLIVGTRARLHSDMDGWGATPEQHREADLRMDAILFGGFCVDGETGERIPPEEWSAE